MKKIAFILFMVIKLSPLFGQTPLTVEGIPVNNSDPYFWDGYNVPRNQPTIFKFRNNSITSINSGGYMLQAGDEGPSGSNNNLDGEIISGNQFIWNGNDISTTITHGLFVGYNINSIIAYNYLYRVPTGIVLKSNGMTNSSGGVAYNIINKTGNIAVVVKGINGAQIYNNTFYSDEVRWTSNSKPGTYYGIVDIFANDGLSPWAYSKGTKIKNNIFYTVNKIYNITIEDSQDLEGFESDYNIFYCEAGEPVFDYLGTEITFTQWQALGFDTHSVIKNPGFNNFTEFVPSSRLNNGTNLGTEWQTGLSVSASWILGSEPATANQNGQWQVGARIYSSQIEPVTSITIAGEGNASTISEDDGTLQLSATVLPENATDKTVIWSVINGTGVASINSTGLLKAVANGTVTAIATANDGSGVNGTMTITISNQIVPVTGISVSGAGGSSTIVTQNGSLLLTAHVVPTDATDKTVTWSLVAGAELATVNSAGLVTAIDNGNITVRATANDGSEVHGDFLIAISNQIIPVTEISVTGENGVTSITSDKGSLQLFESVLPLNATDNTVTWSILNGTGEASISSSGLLTAVNNGYVTARATANDNSGISGSLVINISNQLISVTGITISGTGGINSITSDNGSLQLNAAVVPSDASDKTVTWSIVNGTEFASINATGLITALDNGNITVMAKANDGSEVYGTLVVTISNQIIPVTGITITGAAGITSITSDGESLLLNATIQPLNATNKTVIWSLENGTGEATINSAGVVTAVNNGTVTARATASDGSGISGILVINISNQVIQIAAISVTGAGGISTISEDNGSLQLSAEILPLNATNKTVTWSIVNGTGQAEINSTGLVSAFDNGTVTAFATSNDGSGISGSMIITISNQIILLTDIMVTGQGGASIITTENGSLQLFASFLPASATNKSVTWTIVNGTGQATINSTGLVTAVADGNVTAIATANDDSGVHGEMTINISYSLISVTSILISGEGGASEITSNNGSLQLSEEILPVSATDKSVTWSIINGTGLAIINAAGLVTAMGNGTVTAVATANDGSGVNGTMTITISNQIISVTSISIHGAGGASIISSDNGSLQLTEIVLPENATNKSVSWSIVDDTGLATISSTGLVTAVGNGAVVVRATANDGSDIYGTFAVILSNQIVPVTSIIVTGVAGETTIATDNGSLQLTEAVFPANASDNTVTWSIINGTGQAIINSTGLVTAVENGTVTARASSNDGSGIFGTLDIFISNQLVLVNGIIISGEGGITNINTDNGSLQLIASILPADATDKTLTWSIVNGTNLAIISTSGLVTALDNGTITVRATANDGSDVYGTIVITISDQIIPVSNITVRGSGGSNRIRTDNGSLQLSATILPANATDKTVTWSLINGTGLATISATGRVTAIDNGTVTAMATANDGSEAYGILVITISNQIIPVTSISVTGEGSLTIIPNDNGSLHMIETIIPLNATNKTVTWSVSSGTGQAVIDASGYLTAVDNGTVTVTATANDGSGVSGSLVITISNQIVPISDISVTGSYGASIIATNQGTLQLFADVLPLHATDRSVTWSIVNGTGQATINSMGLVTAIDNGTVTAFATANDGSGISGNLVVTIFNQLIPVEGIFISGAGGSTTITTSNGSLQLIADISPENATYKDVTWSVVNGTGRATIDTYGVVTALDNGTVTVIATANDGSEVYGTRVITISNQTGPVTSIVVTGEGGATSITTDKGSLQLTATVLPVNATVRSVTWSFVSGSEIASINSSGLLTAIDNGFVTVKATAKDGTGIYGTLVISISSQISNVTGITISALGGLATITDDDGSLQLIAEVMPQEAKNKTVTWSVINGTGQAIINASGLVTAKSNGTVIALATANDGSGVYGTLVIAITGQIVPVTSITISGESDLTSIIDDNGSLQLIKTVLPSNATVNKVTWSIEDGSEYASINDSGLLTALDNGTVIVMAKATDGSGVYGTIVINISNQIVPVTDIIITGVNGETAISGKEGQLQLRTTVLPENATDKTVTWSIVKGSGLATINFAGLLTAIDNGQITVMASANDGSGIYGLAEIPILIDNFELTSIIVTRDEIKLFLNEHYLQWRADLYNFLGGKILSKIVDSDLFIINISSLPEGIYLVVLSKGENLRVARIVKP